jgi:hypothetical protein
MPHGFPPLRARRKRPGSDSTCNSFDEIAAPHWLPRGLPTMPDYIRDL